MCSAQTSHNTTKFVYKRTVHKIFEHNNLHLVSSSLAAEQNKSFEFNYPTIKNTNIFNLLQRVKKKSILHLGNISLVSASIWVT